MRKQHQQIIYITILLCLVSTFAYSQKPCPLYDKAMNAGKTAAKAENYQFAINKFLVAQVAARECDKVTKEPSEELDKIFKKLEQQKLEQQKLKSEDAKNQAIKDENKLNKLKMKLKRHENKLKKRMKLKGHENKLKKLKMKLKKHENKLKKRMKLKKHENKQKKLSMKR